MIRALRPPPPEVARELSLRVARASSHWGAAGDKLKAASYRDMLSFYSGHPALVRASRVEGDVKER